MSFIAEHAEPARRWTLLELAKLAGMSRTTFAERFREVVGQTPLDYLAGWRMRLAAERLHRTDDSVASIGFWSVLRSEANSVPRFVARPAVRQCSAGVKVQMGTLPTLAALRATTAKAERRRPLA